MILDFLIREWRLALSLSHIPLWKAHYNRQNVRLREALEAKYPERWKVHAFQKWIDF